MSFKVVGMDDGSTIQPVILMDKEGDLLDIDSPDFNSKVALGLVEGSKAVNKFGRSTNVDSGVDTDIWDRANATNDQDIWVAPTQARVHNIVSSSVNDDSAGTGAKTIKIYGLTSWDTKEVSETITMDGTTNVATTNSYVIIHRMKLLTWGSGGTNAGLITATAVTDATVTAQINASEGQTQMAIYGISSLQTALMTKYYCSAIKASASLSVKMSLLVNTYCDNELTGFLIKHTIGIATEGTNYTPHEFNPYFAITGPAIIKIQGNSSSDNTDVSAGFDLILIDN